jgi:hypothetical protein
MNRKGLLITALFLGSALVAPLATSTFAKPKAVSVKIYDRDHKDYHVWDDRESHAYELYRHDHPEFKVEFKKNNARQQSAYWNWRHEHPDHD